jgi:hypothetical protein
MGGFCFLILNGYGEKKFDGYKTGLKLRRALNKMPHRAG